MIQEVKLGDLIMREKKSFTNKFKKEVIEAIVSGSAT